MFKNNDAFINDIDEFKVVYETINNSAMITRELIFEEVRKEVQSGQYHFEDEVDVYAFPRCWRFIPLGKAKVTHTIEDGFTLEGFYNGQPYRITRKPLQSNSLHIEYDYCYIKPFDCFEIPTEDDSFNCFPTKNDVITKLGFAVEEIYNLHLEKINK